MMEDSSDPVIVRKQPARARCYYATAVFLMLAITGYFGFRQLMLNAMMNRLRWDMIKISKATSDYKNTFGHWPVNVGSIKKDDIKVRSEGPIINRLLGREIAGNPKAIRFLDYAYAWNNIRNGLVYAEAKENAKIVDNWGESFYLVLDANEDGHISNPEVGQKMGWFWARQPVPATLKSSVIIYSGGADRNPTTWHDNLCSWRSVNSLVSYDSE